MIQTQGRLTIIGRYLIRVTSFLLSLILFFSFCNPADAGVFRVRDRFNVQATGHGFWMKGKCVLPGDRIGIPDDSAVFPDAGCIVKNRKGKRRPRKEKADISMNIDYFGNAAGTLRVLASSSKTCTNSRRCRNKEFLIDLEEIPDPVGDITGLYACIEGSKNGRSAVPQQVIVSVGDIPNFRAEERRQFLTRLCPSGTLFP